MAKSSKREQLIRAAVELFSRKGFHAVGIDSIVSRSGVTKKTLYNHFNSKEELILASLRHYDENFRNQFIKNVESKSKNPLDRLLAIFDVFEEWFDKKDFFGCIFVGAMNEYPAMDTPIRRFCKESKTITMEYIKNLAVEAQLKDAELISEQIIILLEGSVTMAQANHNSQSAVLAKNAARILIQNSLSSS